MVRDGECDHRLCPICVEELDLTDRSFKPCSCGFQLCIWCFHNITEKGDGKCPNCRSVYQHERLGSMHVEPEVLEAAVLEKRRKEKVKLAGKPNQPGSAAALNPENLLNVRILQRNLVYVIGLSASVAKEEVLRKKEYFGRFGKILKVAVNRKPTQTSNSQKSSCSAYVTFKREEDALDAIQNINGTVLDGRTVRATFGTTKYCSFFLKNASCSNPNCLYLHELADDKDCFLKDDLNASERSLESSGLTSLINDGDLISFNNSFFSTQTKDSSTSPKTSSDETEQEPAEESEKPKSNLSLPGLTVFGSGALGWTPAKEPSDAKSLTRAIPSEIQTHLNCYSSPILQFEAEKSGASLNVSAYQFTEGAVTAGDPISASSLLKNDQIDCEAFQKNEFKINHALPKNMSYNPSNVLDAPPAFAPPGLFPGGTVSRQSRLLTCWTEEGIAENNHNLGSTHGVGAESLLDNTHRTRVLTSRYGF